MSDFENPVISVMHWTINFQHTSCVSFKDTQLVVSFETTYDNTM